MNEPKTFDEAFNTANNYMDLNHQYLTKVKLILGNGFDLMCGLDSSYKCFFETSKPIFDNLDNWIKGKPLSDNNHPTVWDLCFHILETYSECELYKNKIENVNWKNIEEIMKKLLFPDSTLPISLKYSTIENKSNNSMQSLLNKYVEKYKNTESTYYEYLFKELKEFELRFSSFISNQMTDEYNKKAEILLSNNNYLGFKLIEKNEQTKEITVQYNLKSIDTFNYTSPAIFKKLKKHGVKVRHVNGDLSGPIFGIDTGNISIDDPRFIFTKTYRKMIKLVTGHREEFNRNFENVVVFGHSLASADDSYFFPILDHLELGKFNVHKKRFLIAFTEYKGFSYNRLSWNVLRLLDSFDRWLHPDSIRTGLVEMLETSDRIGFAKIPTIVDENKKELLTSNF